MNRSFVIAKPSLELLAAAGAVISGEDDGSAFDAILAKIEDPALSAWLGSMEEVDGTIYPERRANGSILLDRIS